MMFVVRRVRASAPVRPSRFTVSVSSRPSRMDAVAPGRRPCSPCRNARRTCWPPASSFRRPSWIFIGRQLDLEHLAELRRLYGFRSNEDLVRRFVEACRRRTRTILPATTTI